LLARRETRKEGETDLVVLCSEGSESNSQAGQSHSERKWKDHYKIILTIRYHLRTRKLSNSLTYSAGESFLELVSSVEQSGSKYTALYVSDPYWYTSYKTLQRFLAETAKGNSTPEIATGCDELCKFKSSLLEGILVVITLFTRVFLVFIVLKKDS